MTARRKTEPPIPPLPTDYPDPLLMLDSVEPGISTDVMDKVNAGARLTFALFMHPQARDLFSSPLMTKTLRDAYFAACRAWGL